MEEKILDIYSYVLQEEQAYKTARVPLASNWKNWNMYEHVDRSFMLKNSKFYLGPEDFSRPFNNIILPIANVNYRTEGFDVKDAELYVDNADNYHKSFVARKFHNWWAKENGIDTAIDESVESYFDYGLTLVKNVNEARPEIVQPQQIAFCDQTDILSGPICLKHEYSVSELLDMKDKWDSKEIDKTLLMARTKKEMNEDEGEVETPGKYVKVYELHGMFPESWLGAEKLGEEWEDTGKYSEQLHIITYYISPIDDKTKNGITLFKGKETKPVFKALKRDPIYGRACGRGGIEELFHPQIWTNYSELHLQQMLEAVSKVVLKSTDKKLKNQKLNNIKHGQTIFVEDGKTFEQLAIQPINKSHFDNFVNKWEQVARTIGSASDPALGLNPTSGTPLGTTEIITTQGVGIHEYRQGKIATFWMEIYRDWVLPHLSREINKGHKWLDELSMDELQEVSEKIAAKEVDRRRRELYMNGILPSQQEIDAMKMFVMEEFSKGGEKRFIEAVKDEFKNLAMDIEINIANKHKNSAQEVSKLNSIFRAVFTPQGVQMLQQSPELAGLLNQILEGSGLSPVRFSGFTKQPMQTEAIPTQPELAPVA